MEGLNRLGESLTTTKPRLVGFVHFPQASKTTRNPKRTLMAPLLCQDVARWWG
jgi:hypothetical protein